MNVSLDVSAVPARPAGAGRYIYELAKRLAVSDLVDVTCISRRADEARWRSLGASVVAAAPDLRPVRLIWEQMRMPALLDGGDYGLHHGPHYTLPERAKLPLVSTIHDMTFFDHPEWHERAKVPVFRRAITKAVERADRLIAVSRFTADRLGERFGVEATVIPLAVDHGRFSTDSDKLVDRQLLRALGIGGTYIAYVGTLEPRKNVPALVRAFSVLAERDRDLQLILAGGYGWGVDDVLAAVDASKFKDRIIVTGYLPDQVIPALFRRSLFAVYPSMVEGFGLPALEALACGAPLVTTKGSVMQEVVGDAAVLADVADEDALSEALLQLYEDDALREGLRLQGPVVASDYTWDRCASQHVQLYQEVAGADAGG